MQAIIDFFSGLGEIIGALVKLVINFVTDLVSLFELFTGMSSIVPEFFTWLPSVAVSLMFTCILLVIAFRVLGRD